MTIGERIREERHNRRWTQRVLALKTEFTEQSITNWETDRVKPSEHAIRALERAFGSKLRK